jgi:hypothetical protein
MQLSSISSSFIHHPPLPKSSFGMRHHGSFTKKTQPMDRSSFIYMISNTSLNNDIGLLLLVYVFLLLQCASTGKSIHCQNYMPVFWLLALR